MEAEKKEIKFVAVENNTSKVPVFMGTNKAQFPTDAWEMCGRHIGIESDIFGATKVVIFTHSDGGLKIVVCKESKSEDSDRDIYTEINIFPRR
jgi:hypothetical protein